MLELTYDLHIHSCLSTCGDDAMTPANIVGMAAIKELDVIAVTDHNSCKNCPAVLAAAEAFGVLAIPGMEMTTSEEVHAVCLFPTLESAMDFDAMVYGKLLPFPNDETIFGKQQIYNADDEMVDTVPYLLINSVEISFDGLWDLVRSYDGVMFPAHIEKSSNSLLVNLGFVPPDSRFRTFELKDLGKLHAVRQANPYLETCQVLHNSDAHYLEHIHEPEWKLRVEEPTVAGVLEAIRSPLL